MLGYLELVPKGLESLSFFTFFLMQKDFQELAESMYSGFCHCDCANTVLI